MESKPVPEYFSEESSLTAPEDRDQSRRWRPNQSAPPLTENEVASAMKELNVTSFTDNFPCVDRVYADPPVPLQTYGLISFTPAKGAVPNENGLYGFVKMRGNYATATETEERVEYLIRTAGTAHHVYHTWVGRPFPIAVRGKYSTCHEVNEIRKEITQANSNEIKERRQLEKQEERNMIERQEALLDESMNTDEPDMFEEYITISVKKAQLTWNYLEHQKKIVEIKALIIKARTKLSELDITNPEYKNMYFDKYMKARKRAHIQDTPQSAQDNFIKYMLEDVVLDFDNESPAEVASKEIKDTISQLQSIYNKLNPVIIYDRAFIKDKVVEDKVVDDKVVDDKVVDDKVVDDKVVEILEEEI